MAKDMQLEDLADEVEKNRMPLLEHLVELRTRMMWAGAGLILGMLASLGLVEPLMHWLVSPFNTALVEAGVKGGLSLVTSPFEGIYTWLSVAFVGGVALASPLLTVEAWLFIAPGLYSTEKRVVVPLAMTSTALFFVGALFCYYAIFPFAFPFFLKVVEVEASLSISGYLSAILKMMGAFGLSFQLPVATFFVARIGLVDARDMIEAFRYAIIAIFVIAAVITPPDVLTQCLLAGPLILLYILSIGVAWLFTTKQRLITEGS